MNKDLFDMVETQVIPRGVKDMAVIEAMKRVDRADFAPLSERKNAYSDGPQSIGKGQTISQPYIVALMLEILRLKPGLKALEVGCGSGYVAALLSFMGLKTTGIEYLLDLCKLARRNLTNAGFKNVSIICADGLMGLPRLAPIHRIILSAAVPSIPPPLIEQLAMDGIMVAPVGDINSQNLICFIKTKNGNKEESLGGCIFVPMKGRYGFPSQ